MNIGKQKTTEFINQLELIAKNIDANNIVNDAAVSYNEKNYIETLVNEARELITYNEWFIALENTIDNLFEIDYKLDGKLVNLAMDVFKISSSMDKSRLNALEEMRK